jgi:hypothetical protein
MVAKRKSWVWRIGLALISLAGILCLAWLLGTPSEKSSAFFLGYSFPRVLLAVGLIVPSLIAALLSLPRSRKIIDTVNAFLQNKPHLTLYWILVGFNFSVLISCWLLFFLPEKRSIQLLGSFSLYIAVAKPFLLFGICVAAITFLYLLNVRYQFALDQIKKDHDYLRLSLFIFLSLIVVAGLISISGIGLGFDATVWNAPGTPILITQAVLVIVFAILLIAFISRLRNKYMSVISDSHINIALAGTIWIMAAIFWLAQPAPSTYYDTAPQPPNYQPYPLSDAFNHDVIANNVLVGEGFHFGGQVAVRRPVYIMFLAGLESLFGGNYSAVIAGQVIVLALFPAILFLLGTKMHSRLAGLLLAGFVIFREANSIVLGDVINTSHAKLLMADLPTAFIVSGFALAAFAWFRREPDRKVPALLVGGLLGWAILLRSQSLTLLPLILLLAFLVWGLQKAWKPAMLFLVGVILVASPWILRNKVLMGQWAIEDAVVSGFLANRYSFTPGTFGLPFLSGESEGEYYARQMAQVRNFAIQNPGYVAGFVADNFVRNQLLNFLVTPLSLQLRDLESHVRDLPYWPGWLGELDPETYLPMAASLVLISIGAAVAWKRFAWLGLLPLFINVGFTLNLALARVSGWRYNLPIDWTVLFYYALGIAQVVFWTLLLVRNRGFVAQFLGITSSEKNVTRSASRRVSPNVGFFLAILLFFLVGSSFLIIERLSSPRYTTVTPSDAINAIESTNAVVLDQQKIIDLIDSGKAKTINGRALYPRYYRAGEGEPDRNFLLIDPMDFERITFYLIGPNPASVVFRVNSPNIDLPSSSDVLVMRCADSTEAAAIVVMNTEDGERLYLSSDLSRSCPEK